TDLGGSVSANAQRGVAPREGRGPSSAGASASIGFISTDRGTTSESAGATLDIVNFDVRSSIAIAEQAAARSSNPERTFTATLSNQLLGDQGLRNRYLEQAD